MIDLKEIETKIKNIINKTKSDINIITTHRAFPEVFTGLNVNGAKLVGLASVSSVSNTTVTVKPFDKSNFKTVEEAVRKVAGYTIVIKGDVIYLEIMPLYKEVIDKKQKEANTVKENALINIRQLRQDALNFMKKNKNGVSENITKKYEKDLQKIIDDNSEEIKKLL
jgi:ribosome recycling factor